ncbi:MAG: hypothetical protein ACXWID_04375 [Pyrinomonadaceae bacterium]
MSTSSDVIETADLVNAFVEERIDIPDKNEIDIWRIGVCAALFSAAFEMSPLITHKFSADEFNKNINYFIESVASGASQWVGFKIRESLKLQDDRIRLDETDVLLQSLKVCFSEAFSVMESRNYDARSARSHACFCLTSQGIRDLIETGHSISPHEGRDAVVNIMGACDSISDEIGDMISNR